MSSTRNRSLFPLF
uniref:Uncharacterized protein n=1 Tax=Arundo donax TaxID=35708 RepID=A0A0A8ZPA6_ARUDO